MTVVPESAAKPAVALVIPKRDSSVFPIKPQASNPKVNDLAIEGLNIGNSQQPHEYYPPPQTKDYLRQDGQQTLHAHTQNQTQQQQQQPPPLPVNNRLSQGNYPLPPQPQMPHQLKSQPLPFRESQFTSQSPG
ncbi:hypothetical protein BGZ76_001419, partial [Entomortierella beljakovae]